MNRVQIAPSILSCDFLRLGQEIRDVEEAGADLIHIDVMDGHFVPNITIGSLIVEATRKVNSRPLDVHLMIAHPERFVLDFARAGADIITIHVETDCHILRTIDFIKSQGKKAGIALNPATPQGLIEHIVDYADLILVMTVNPGFGGQKYIVSMERKIEAVREMITKSGREVDLEVDGGIKASNAKKVVGAGANILVMGTEIFHSKNYREKFEEIRKNLET
jgi:ribulose-phosphate 3-epimerase